MSLPRKRIMFILGTRPEAIKLAPVILEIEKYPDIFHGILVSTGQHREMLNQVLKIFSLRPDYNLRIMEEEQTISSIVIKCLKELENVILRENPDFILVQGDTSTAFAAALSSFYHQVPLGHVEAGLRTFDKWKPFPEEINRKLISSLADFHFAPTKKAVENLLKEGMDKKDIFLTGNTVIDAAKSIAKNDFDFSKIGIEINDNKKLVLVTIHRRESFGSPMKSICSAISEIARIFKDELQIVFPVHKNPIVRKQVFEILNDFDNIDLIEPLDYEPFINLMKRSHIILTDSGGIQEEAPTFGVPVLVAREKTERPEALEAKVVKLVGTNKDIIISEMNLLLKDEISYKNMAREVSPYGDGKASERIVQVILRHFGFTDIKPEEFAYEKN